MKCWVYVDNQNRVMASNISDMNGNTGWHETKYPVPEVLVDHRNIALYKWDGEMCIGRTAEEIEADVQPEPERQPTEAERLEALEAESVSTMLAITEVYELILGG